MIKTVALPVRPVVEVDLEFWVRNFDSVAMDVESYAATFCHRLCSNCVRMSYLSPFACRSRNGNSKVAMDVFQRQLLILAKQSYRICKFSVHVLLRITTRFSQCERLSSTDQDRMTEHLAAIDCSSSSISIHE